MKYLVASTPAVGALKLATRGIEALKRTEVGIVSTWHATVQTAYESYVHKRHVPLLVISGSVLTGCLRLQVSQ